VTCQGLNKYLLNSNELLNEMAFDAMENYIVAFIHSLLRNFRQPRGKKISPPLNRS
jgi:hypothetical protein